MNRDRSAGFQHGAFIKWMFSPAWRAALRFMERKAEEHAGASKLRLTPARWNLSVFPPG